VARKIKFSSLVSFVSHPIFIPFWGVLAIVSFHWVSASKYNGDFLKSLLSIILLTTIFIPIFALGSLFQKYRPSDFVHFDRKERSYSAWILCSVYLALLWLLPLLYQDKMIRIFFIAMAASTLVAGIVNWFYKISFHMLGWAGLLVLFFVLNNQSFIDLFSIILAIVLWIGIVAFARIKEKAHNSNQVYAGFLIGLSVNALIYLITYGI
jgi:hypothetical protein